MIYVNLNLFKILKSLVKLSWIINPQLHLTQPKAHLNPAQPGPYQLDHWRWMTAPSHAINGT